MFAYIHIRYQNVSIIPARLHAITHTPGHTHTHTHTHTRACRLSSKQAYSDRETDTDKYTYTHPSYRARAHTHTHIDTPPHTHTCKLDSLPVLYSVVFPLPSQAPGIINVHITTWILQGLRGVRDYSVYLLLVPRPAPSPTERSRN